MILFILKIKMKKEIDKTKYKYYGKIYFRKASVVKE